MTSAWEPLLSNSEAAAIEEFKELVRIPSVSTDPARSGDVRRTAEWVADRLRTAGVPVVEIVDEGGHPAVIGRWEVGSVPAHRADLRPLRCAAGGPD